MSGRPPLFVNGEYVFRQIAFQLSPKDVCSLGRSCSTAYDWVWGLMRTLKKDHLETAWRLAKERLPPMADQGLFDYIAKSETQDIGLCIYAFRCDAKKAFEVIRTPPREMVEYACQHLYGRLGIGVCVWPFPTDEVPTHLLTEEACLCYIEGIAARQELGRSLEDVPLEFRSFRVCVEAYIVDRTNLRFVPEHLKAIVFRRFNIP